MSPLSQTSGKNIILKSSIPTSKNILTQVNCFRCFAYSSSRDMKNPIKYIWMAIVEPHPEWENTLEMINKQIIELKHIIKFFLWCDEMNVVIQRSKSLLRRTEQNIIKQNEGKILHSDFVYLYMQENLICW